MNQSQPTLKRVLTLSQATFYGVGAILGAGIYVLVGEVVALAGYATALAFLLAAFIALMTAFSYAELGSQFPRSAGEAVYVEEGFQKAYLTRLVGLLVIFSGAFSTAAMVRGFTGYLAVFVDLPLTLVVILLITAMTLIAVWGISLSVWLICSITVLEVLGLVGVCFLSHDVFTNLPDISLFLVPADWQSASGVFAGAFLAFYAFIGFEDIANIAEEVKEPERNLPRAILVSLIVATVLYVLVSVVAVIALPLEEIAGHPAPMAAIVESHGFDSRLISLISLIAIINGAMVQIIMASRVLYGMANLRRLPAWLATVNSVTQTPVNATLVISLIILVLALWLPLRSLAGLTSTAILVVFALVNGALIRLKLQGQMLRSTIRVPIVVPVVALILCLLLLVSQVF